MFSVYLQIFSVFLSLYCPPKGQWGTKNCPPRTRMKYLFSAMEAKLSLVDSGKNITILTPVSYTHLDVYKRQGSKKPSRLMRPTFPTWERENAPPKRPNNYWKKANPTCACWKAWKMCIRDRYCGMDNALGMHNDLDLVQIHTEQPLYVHDFQAFVHQRGRINGDLPSHGPVGMLQSILHLNILQLLSGPAAERTTSCLLYTSLSSSSGYSLRPFCGFLHPVR